MGIWYRKEHKEECKQQIRTGKELEYNRRQEGKP